MPFPPLPGMFFPTEAEYKHASVTEADRNLGSLAMGWTLGYSFFVVKHAIKESRRIKKINSYLVFIWLEIIANTSMAIQAYLWLQGTLKPSFFHFFFIVFAWVIQTQCIMQIIINRLCILLASEAQRNRLRWGVAALIGAINLSVFVVWMPAQLQINARIMHINMWYDRVQKIMFLVIDATLNWYFIRTVKMHLVDFGGLKKYRRVVRYNTQIIWVSVGMDVLIIAMMSLKNGLVYVQFHPVAYMVKLNIEMALSKLIIRVARETGVSFDEDTTNRDKSISISGRGTNSAMQVSVQVTRTVQRGDEIELESQPSGRAWEPTKEREGGDHASVDSSLQKDTKDNFNAV